MTVVLLSGCKAMVARFWDKAHVYSTASLCPDRILAVGDSIPFRASVMIRNAPGGMQGAFDNVTLYTSGERPQSFEWVVAVPPASAATASGQPPGRADISRTGMLIARDTGVVYVHAKTAGKEAARVEVRIIPRVTAFALVPRDTSVRVGDTIVLRASAELAGSYPYTKFNWVMPLDTFETRRVERVEEDPDVQTKRPLLEYPLLALRPGTQKVEACFAGARRDTATIRITGEPLAVNRNVPPAVRFSPTDTTVYVGEEFSGKLRILNARLRNGPYRWETSIGDSSAFVDSTESAGSPSAFGFERDVFSRHRYLAAGTYPLRATVTDSAGRSTTVRGTYTAVIREFQTMVVLPDGRRRVRLDSSDEPDVAIALLENTSKRLFPAHIAGAMVLTRMSGVPPLLFGRTVFDPEPDGRRRVRRDVNGDGEIDDVFYLDKATLRRNGDLRIGRNRIVITGAVGARIDRPGKEPLYPPIRAVVEFEAIP